MASAPAEDLKIAIESPRTWARRLTITVPAGRVQRERDDVARRLAKRVKLSGFRKGKVPAHVLERRFGPAIDQEAVERLVDSAYREALQREGLEPISRAAVENLDYRPGAELTFDVEFEVQPEIELPRLGGFQVEYEKGAVGDEEVDRVVERLREEHAVWRPLEEGTPAAGDVVEVEITPLGTGEEAPPGEPRRYRIGLGEGQAVPDVEDAIRTLEPGAEGEFTIRLAEEAAAAEGGAERRVRIKLVSAERPELPAADDDFARSVGDFEDIEALRSRIRVDLEREAEAEAERSLRERLLDRILEANPFEVPDSMVARYLERALPAREGADPARVEEARQLARPAAERAIKRMLVIERVAEQEGLRATAEEVDARVEAIAERMGRPASEVWARLQKSGRLQALEEEATEEKVFEFLKSKSTIGGAAGTA